MRRTYRTADYEIKQGRFLIVPSRSGDKYVEVASDVRIGTDEAREIALKGKESSSYLKGNEGYWIHEGFIIVNSKDFRDCTEILFVSSCEEANEALSRLRANLNA